MFRYYRFKESVHKYLPVTQADSFKCLYISSDDLYGILVGKISAVAFHNKVVASLKSDYVLVPFKNIDGQHVILECEDVWENFSESVSKHIALGGKIL